MSCNKPFIFLLFPRVRKFINKTVNRKTNRLVSKNTTAVDVQAKTLITKHTFYCTKKVVSTVSKSNSFPPWSLSLRITSEHMIFFCQSNLANIRPSKDGDWHM